MAGKFITINELADQATFLIGDYQQINRMRFQWLASKFVFPDLQYDVVKEAKRAYMWINKRTNSIEIPSDCLSVSSVSWVDCWGNIHPVYINKNVHRDIVDMGRAKNCACSCSGDLCNLVKGYESVITYPKAQMPDGSEETFTCTSRKWVTPDGKYYEQIQEPKRVYDANGEWVDTEVGTTDIELCEFEMRNGCIYESDANYDLLDTCGGIMWDTANCVKTPPELKGYKVIKERYAKESGAWFSNVCGFQNSYDINDGGTRIVFPYNFNFDRVLVRYYANVPKAEMKIPYVAAVCALYGIRYYDVFMDDDKQQLAALWDRKYTNAKYSLIEELNKYTTAELINGTNPPAFVPSAYLQYY